MFTLFLIVFFSTTGFIAGVLVGRHNAKKAAALAALADKGAAAIIAEAKKLRGQ